MIPSTTPASRNGGFLHRIASWIKNPRHRNRPDAAGSDQMSQSTALAPMGGMRGSFFRPWGKRDAALANLHEGFVALSGVMGSLKESLERQNQRQEELVNHIEHLPQFLESIPQTNQAQTEVLQTIAEQIRYQSSQQAKLGEILEKVSETEGNQRQILEALHDRIGALNEHDRLITDSLQGVGFTMQRVSDASQTGQQVLERIRDNINVRQLELQAVLQKQAFRNTIMLATSLLLAVCALAAVGVFGYMVMCKLH